jgi:hypothetical protein
MRSNSDQLEKKLIELLRFPSTSGTLSFEIKVNSCLILIKFASRKAKMYVVFCGYFKISFKAQILNIDDLKKKKLYYLSSSTTGIIELCF